MQNLQNSLEPITQLFSIRNQYGQKFALKKQKLLKTLFDHKVKSKKGLQLYADTLHFLLAYPDNKATYRQAAKCLSNYNHLFS